MTTRRGVTHRLIKRFFAFHHRLQQTVVGMSVPDVVTVFGDVNGLTLGERSLMQDFLREGRLNGTPQLEIVREGFIYPVGGVDEKGRPEYEFIEAPKTIRTIRHTPELRQGNGTRTSVIPGAEQVHALT